MRGTVSGTLIFRADAGPELGHGHVMRCLALAEKWKERGGDAAFVMAQCPESLKRLLAAYCCQVVLLNAPAGSDDDVLRLLEFSRARRAEAVVLDGRQFDSRYQGSIVESGVILLYLDDDASAESYCADLVWNADLPIKAQACARLKTRARLLLGPEYALIRGQFSHASPNPRVPPTATRLLVSMGATDPTRLTDIVIASLRYNDSLEIRIVTGSANRNLSELRRAVGQYSAVEVLTDVSDMVAQMRWAEMAVAAAGVVVWELLFMGIPTICWPRYEQDLEFTCALEQCGAALSLRFSGDARFLSDVISRVANDQHLRSRMSLEARKLVDGRGAERVISELSAMLQEKTLRAKAIWR